MSFEAGQHFEEHTHQTTIEYAQGIQHLHKPQQPPRRKATYAQIAQYQRRS